MTDTNRLTDEQRKLVEENAQLIYGFIHKYNLPADDFYDLCAIGLCRAAKNYEPKKGAFSTWAYMYMLSELTHLKRKNENRINADLSLDEPVKGYTKEHCTVGEFLVGTRSDITEHLSAACTPGVDRLTAREKAVALYLTVGLSHREIGLILGISHSRVYQHKNAIRKKLSAALQTDDA